MVTLEIADGLTDISSSSTDMLTYSFKGITTATGAVSVTDDATAAELSGTLTLTFNEQVRTAAANNAPYEAYLTPGNVATGA